MTRPSDPASIATHVLESETARIRVLSVGCAIQSWEVAGAAGGRSIVLGYADPADYIANPVSMGVVVGRVANRIRNARFTLEGREYLLPANAAPHHLHGGPVGWARRLWQMEPEGNRAVRLSRISPDGEEGWPGTVRASVVLRLDGPTLTWEMEAVPDRPTPINLAQHCYFNLAGRGDVMDHSLRIAARRYTPNGTDLLPTGEIRDVAGTAYDFRQLRRLGEADPARQGHDASLVLDEDRRGPAAQLLAPGGLALTLQTDRPALQLYTSVTLRRHGSPLPGPAHRPFAAVCLEAQDFPNAVNEPAFPSIVATPERPYRQTTSITVARSEA